MKFGARNQISGKVVEIKKGDLMCQVKVEISDAARMTSVMTTDSLDDLDIRVGESVQIVVKAVNVLLVKETA